MNNNNRFLDGLLIGLILGGAAVFLFGTKSGKNLLKIISEQGLEGISDLMEEYGQEWEEEDLDAEGPLAEEAAREDLAKDKNGQEKHEFKQEYTSENPQKKRFFKRHKN